MAFKIAFIGAGSIGFTRGLLADILTVPEFKNIEVSFMDINPDNLRMVTELCQRDIDENGGIWIGVIEQDAAGSCNFTYIFTKFENGMDSSLAIHNAADTECIADALVNSVF